MLRYCGSESVASTVWKLSFAASIYHLWRERNSRIFARKRLDDSTIINNIVSDVRACLLSWKEEPVNDTTRRLCIEWNIRGRTWLGQPRKNIHSKLREQSACPKLTKEDQAKGQEMRRKRRRKRTRKIGRKWIY